MNKIMIACIGFIVLGLWGCAEHKGGYPKPLQAMSVREMFPSDLKAQALALAAAEGDITRIDKLIDRGADVNTRGAYGVTVPTWVLYHPNKEGFKRLMERGADPNIVWDDGNCLVHWAAFLSYSIGPDYLRMALEIGHGDPNIQRLKVGTRPVEYVLEDNEAFAVLYNAGADIHFFNKGNGPWFLSTGNNFELLYFLFNDGVANHCLESSFCEDILQKNIQREIKINYWLRTAYCQNMWFWRCVDFLEKKGMRFNIPHDLTRPSVLDTTSPSILKIIKKR